jgi:Ca2+-binding EF-hand superfamily protein
MTPNSLALLSKVKNAIVNNHLDMEVAFKHFDLDGNGYLDKKEFENLVKVFYGKAELPDITETFVILDSSKQSKVNINDFKSILN